MYITKDEIVDTLLNNLEYDDQFDTEVVDIPAAADDILDLIEEEGELINNE